MTDGTKKPIDQVEIGDTVTATEPKSSKTGPHKVTALIRHNTDHGIIDVNIHGEHRKWVYAGDLQAGDRLRSAKEPAPSPEHPGPQLHETGGTSEPPTIPGRFIQPFVR